MYTTAWNGIITLEDVRRANPNWFEKPRFHGDLRYSLHPGGSGMPYLVRSTYAWTDMLGAKKRLFYVANPIDHVTLKIQPILHDTDFRDFREWDTLRKAIAWLKKNG